MRKAIAICGAVACYCIVATQLFVGTPLELKAEQPQAERTDETARIEEKLTVAEQRIARLEEQNARLEEQLRQLMGSLDRPETTDQRLQTADHGFGSKDKTDWLEGATEPAGTATASDVLTGKTFYSGGSWAQDTGTATLGALPSGVIMMWSGLLTYIPAGWALCNGDTIVTGSDTVITPDLRDRFIMGVSGSAEDPGATGGANTYSLTVDQLPTHAHTGTTQDTGEHHHQASQISSTRMVSGDRAWPPSGTESALTSEAGLHNHSFVTDSTGSGAEIDNRPPFFKLAFIMKLTGKTAGVEEKVIELSAVSQSPLSGLIAMWSGTILTIPEGWALCDGGIHHGVQTPNLRDRFIKSVSGSVEDPGATGGANTYSLTVDQLPTHAHTGMTEYAGAHTHTFASVGGPPSWFHWDVGGNRHPSSVMSVPTGPAGIHNHSFVTDSIGYGAEIDNRPAYYKLAFIMKL